MTSNNNSIHPSTHAHNRGSPEGLKGFPKFDYILAADCIYDDSVVEIFLETMHGLADENTIIYFAQQCHNEDAMKVLWARIDHYFVVRKVHLLVVAFFLSCRVTKTSLQLLQISLNEQVEKWRDKAIDVMEMKKKVLT